MAKKATKKGAKKASAAKSAKKKSAAKTVKRNNVKILVDRGALDAGAAARLDTSVVRAINRYTRSDVAFLVRHQKKICGVARPAPDGSFF